MARSFVLSLQKPHESLGVALPLGKRLANDRSRLSCIACVFFGLVFLAFSIISVNISAAKSFDRRTLERSAERLSEQVNELSSRVAVLQSYSSLKDRVEGLGYVAIEKTEFLD